MKRLWGDTWITFDCNPENLFIGVLWQKMPQNYFTALGHCIEEIHISIHPLPFLRIFIVHGSRYEQPYQI